ncbi:MAG TPA: hypothetical protein PKE30_10245 [Niabella sp.]|nr:hypothetical protein [Niabella sp.]
MEKYQFIDSKTMIAGSNINRMDLYYYDGDIDLEKLKSFCRSCRDSVTSELFLIVVVFRNKKDAVFPNVPFTAAFGDERAALSNVRIMYTYNSVNKYSKVEIYEKNAWNSRVYE